jgi:uncharacterized membrane protein YdjX (TVP38/TMEM64 family)
VQAVKAPRPQAVRRRAIAFLLALVAVLVGGLVLSAHVGPGAIASTMEGARAVVDGHPVLSALGFSVLYTTVAALAVPAVWLLSVAAGALFGPWFGLPIAIASGVMGGTITMLAARYAVRGWVEARFPETLARFDQGAARGGARFLFAARLTPVIPFALVNLALGLTEMPARTFALVSAVGYLPLTIAYVSAGASLGAIRSPADALSPRLLITFLALAAAPFAAPAWTACRSRRRPSVA